jgi:hypothetical protein
MKRVALVLAAAVAATALFAGSAAGAVKTVKSTVTIASGNGSEFKGRVSSSQKACRANRKVTLFKEPYAGEGGEDEAVGTDRTSASGAWSVQGSFIAGLYYARVASVLVHVNGQPIRCSFDVNMAARF